MLQISSFDSKTHPNSKNPMEETKSTTTTHYHDSTTRSFPSSPEPTSPSSPAPPSPAAESSLSSDLSDLSHHSSPSHGSSPEQEKSRNPVPPSLNSPAPAYPPARSFPEQEKARNPVQPPGNSTEPEYPPSPEQEEKTRRPDSPPGNSPAYSPPPRSPSPEPLVFRFARGGMEAVRKVDRGPVERERVYGGAAAERGGGGRRPAGFRRGGKREETVRKVGLGARVCGLVFCLVSFGVMASDKNKGWAVDSFFRYKEFRYCLSVNAIGFVYSFAQVSYLAYHLATGEYVFRHPLCYYFDFGMDQILTYFLMSASSSAATRVENWVSNWGPDKFPEMATASVALSYLAFLAFASNSLISGYALSVFRST